MHDYERFTVLVFCKNLDITKARDLVINGSIHFRELIICYNTDTNFDVKRFIPENIRLYEVPVMEKNKLLMFKSVILEQYQNNYKIPDNQYISFCYIDDFYMYSQNRLRKIHNYINEYSGENPLIIKVNKPRFKERIAWPLDVANIHSDYILPVNILRNFYLRNHYTNVESVFQLYLNNKTLLSYPDTYELHTVDEELDYVTRSS